EPPASEPPPPSGGRSIAEEVAAAVGGDLATQVERLRSLMAQHSVDLQRLPEKEHKSVVRDLNRLGVPAKVDEPLEVTDIQQVQAIVSVLKKHRLIPRTRTCRLEPDRRPLNRDARADCGDGAH